MSITVTVSTNDGGAAGVLTFADASGAQTRRTLTGETCEAVVYALELVAALAIDPEASTAPDATLAPPAAPAPAPPATPGFPPAPAADPALAPGPAPSPGEPVIARSSHVRFAAGLHGGVLGAPAVIAAGDLFGEVALDRASVLRPSLRLSVHQTALFHVDVAAGSGTFFLSYARAQACPLAFGQKIELRPCLFLDAGGLSASGAGPPVTGAALRPWLAGGGLARVAWVAALGRWSLALELEAGVALPATRENFLFSPSSTIYQAPVALPFADAGLAVHFP